VELFVKFQEEAGRITMLVKRDGEYVKFASRPLRDRARDYRELLEDYLQDSLKNYAVKQVSPNEFVVKKLRKIPLIYWGVR